MTTILALLGSTDASAFEPALLPRDALGDIFRWEDLVRENVREARETDPAVGVTLAKAPSLSWSVLYGVNPEDALDDALASAWAGLSVPTGEPVNGIEAQRLAFAHFEVFLRRMVGVHFGTEVPELVDEPGCQVDLVADNVVRAYGQRIAEPGGGGSPEVLAALDATARSTVCLSQRQLALFEGAVVASSLQVLGAIDDSGHPELREPFVRLLAPLVTLVFDSRKHRGGYSLSYAWMVDFMPELSEGVLRAGWATGEVLLWDRRSGILVGFADCATNASVRCIDPQVFLDSLVDPRAIGMGQCGLAGMLDAGPALIDGDPRYACPARACDSPDPAPTSGGWTLGPAGWAASGSSVPEGQLAGSMSSGSMGYETAIGAETNPAGEIWPGLGADDLASMSDLCLPGSGAMQGAGIPSLEECFADLGSGTPNPFDQHLACLAEVVGSGAPPAVSGELNGVPGEVARCGLSDGEETPPPPPPDPPKDPPPPPPEPTAWDKFVHGVVEFFTDIGNAIAAFNIGGQLAAEGFAGRTAGGAGAAGGAIVAVEATLLNKDLAPAAINGGMVMQLDQGLTRAFDEGKIDAGQWGEQKGKLGSDPNSVKEFLHNLNQNHDCFDPSSCGAGCTGIGEQVGALEACDQALLDALAEAAGLPTDDLERDLGPVINPNPNEGGEEGGFPGAACLADPVTTEGSLACGLVLCSDGAMAFGDPATGFDTCSCAGEFGENAARIQEDLCLSLMCSDLGFGDLDECSCFDSHPGDPGTPPPPPPFTTQTGLTLDEALQEAASILGVSTGDTLIVGSSEVRPGEGTWNPNP